MTGASNNQTRAGRLRLLARLELARHGADLLHSKEEALQRERVRLRGHVARTHQRWEENCQEAATSLLRARALGATTELTSMLTGGPDPATVNAHWQTSMGVAYPGDVDCTPSPEPVVMSTAALRPTIDAYRLALEAAAIHASTTAALHRLDTELANTRRRRRAIEQRLVPSLGATIHELDLHLDEQDRSEALRVHIATSKHWKPRP